MPKFSVVKHFIGSPQSQHTMKVHCDIEKPASPLYRPILHHSSGQFYPVTAIEDDFQLLTHKSIMTSIFPALGHLFNSDRKQISKVNGSVYSSFGIGPGEIMPVPRGKSTHICLKRA
jgi:hypothetical protein